MSYMFPVWAPVSNVRLIQWHDFASQSDISSPPCFYVEFCFKLCWTHDDYCTSFHKLSALNRSTKNRWFLFLPALWHCNGSHIMKTYDTVVLLSFERRLYLFHGLRVQNTWTQNSFYWMTSVRFLYWCHKISKFVWDHVKTAPEMTAHLNSGEVCSLLYINKLNLEKRGIRANVCVENLYLHTMERLPEVQAGSSQQLFCVWT